MPRPLLGGVIFQVGAVYPADNLLGAVNTVQLKIVPVTVRVQYFLRGALLDPDFRCFRPVLVEPVVNRDVPRPFTESQVLKSLSIGHIIYHV